MSERAAEHNYRMALMFYRTERYEDAIAILDDLALEYPDSSHVLYALTKCFLKVGRYAEARELCQELITKHNDERAKTLLQRIGNRKDTYKPPLAASETPPDLPPGAAFAEQTAQTDSPSHISSPPDDTTSSWMSSTPTGLLEDPALEHHSSGGFVSSPVPENASSFSTPPPLPLEDSLVAPPPLHQPESITADSEGKTNKGTAFTGRNMLTAALVLAATVFVLWLVFGPRQFSFPEDHSIGKLAIREIDGPKVKWQEYHDAKGLVDLPRWVYIRLTASSNLTEADLVLLHKARWLRYLDLSQVQVTSEMIEQLAGLKQLDIIDIRGTGLAENDAALLQKWLPTCKVLFDVKPPPKPVAQNPHPPPPPGPAPPSAPPTPPPSPPPTPQPKTEPEPPPVPKEAPPGPRNLVFAGLVGDLLIRPWNAPPDAEWRPYKTARGRITVAAGHIVKLSVRIGSANFGAMRHLSPDTIHTLDLSAIRLEDKGVPFVARLSGLHTLIADRADISGQGLEELCALTELRELSLAGADKFDATGAAKLAALSNLERLVLRGTNATDDFLEPVGKLHNLRHLDISRTKVTDNGLAKLAQLTKLTELDISNTRINGAGLAHLKNLDALERLDLMGNSISPASLKFLGDCKHLRFLQLDGPTITDAALLELAKVTSLSQVNLLDTKATPEAIEKFKKSLPECTVLAMNAPGNEASPAN